MAALPWEATVEQSWCLHYGGCGSPLSPLCPPSLCASPAAPRPEEVPYLQGGLSA